MFDSHVHTDYSTDSKMKIKEAYARGRELNVGIIITEHMDIYYPKKDEFIFDPQEYLQTFGEFRNDNLLLGIELGMRQDYSVENKNIAKGYPFDYILGSIHFIKEEDIFLETTYKGKSKKEIYEDYFKAMYECLVLHPYINSLGHIDYISRYSPYEDKEIYFDDYPDLLNSIFKFLIENDIALELNTRRLNNKATIEALVALYKNYSALGGRLITLGSDAHNTYNVGSNFEAAQELAESCLLKIVHYEKGKIHYE